MGTTQDSIDPKIEKMGFSLHFIFCWHFFKINDGKWLDLI
jgi:hypothetical protein